jgi:hypothetical protein
MPRSAAPRSPPATSLRNFHPLITIMKIRKYFLEALSAFTFIEGYPYRSIPVSPPPTVTDGLGHRDLHDYSHPWIPLYSTASIPEAMEPGICSILNGSILTFNRLLIGPVSLVTSTNPIPLNEKPESRIHPWPQPHLSLSHTRWLLAHRRQPHFVTFTPDHYHEDSKIFR